MATRDTSAPARRFSPALAGRAGWVLAGLAVGVLATLVVGRLTPGPVAETGTMVVLLGRDDSPDGQRQRLLDRWNDTHRDKKARIEELSSTADDQLSEMLSRAQSGRRDVDVYGLDVTWTRQFADADYIQPLEDANTAGFLEGPLATCTDERTLWALPFTTDAGLLYYRTDMLSRADLPKQLPPTAQEVGPVLAKNPTLQAAYAGQFHPYEGLTVNALEAIRGAEGTVVDAAGDVQIDSTQARDGLKRLAETRTTLPGGRTPALDGGKEDTSTDAFRNGRVAMMRNWPVHYGRLAATGSPVKGKFGVVALPGGSVLGGQNLAVAADSRRPAAARELVEYLTSEQSQTSLFLQGGFASPRAASYEDPQVKDKRPYAQALLTAVRAAQPRPVSAHYAAFSAEFRKVVAYALTNSGGLMPRATARLADALEGKVTPPE